MTNIGFLDISDNERPVKLLIDPCRRDWKYSTVQYHVAMSIAMMVVSWLGLGEEEIKDQTATLFLVIQ